VASQVCSMNWNKPRADDVGAAAPGLNRDSTWAVATRYWKLVPVTRDAWRIAPVTAAFVPAASTAMK
jgi:hypothetical protein